MPLSKYYGGKGSSVMKKMKSEYGAKKGERVFYATANKMKNNGKSKPTTCMGRKMEYHSPPKHPEQSDPYAEMDAMTERATQRRPSTYRGQRQEMKPMQRESPEPAKMLQRGLQRLYDIYKGK